MDTRKQETRQNIKTSFMELMVKKDPTDITVSELCKYAHINRSTFYEHFEYMDNLTHEILLDQLKNLVYFQENLKIDFNSPDSLTEEKILNFLDELSENKIICSFINCKDAHRFRSLIIHHHTASEIKRKKNFTNLDVLDAIYRNTGVSIIVFAWLRKVIKFSKEELATFIYKKYSNKEKARTK